MSLVAKVADADDAISPASAIGAALNAKPIMIRLC